MRPHGAGASPFRRSLGAEVDELVIPGRDHFDVAERLAVDDDRLTQRLLLLCSKLRNLAT